ncbi:hypothetical protein ACP70R_029803 [Stipagrostis hirtigluma subsp. patula]
MTAPHPRVMVIAGEGSAPADTAGSVSAAVSRRTITCSPEYPCLTRLRLRRLLAFLGSAIFTDAFEAYVRFSSSPYSVPLSDQAISAAASTDPLPPHRRRRVPGPDLRPIDLRRSSMQSEASVFLDPAVVQRLVEGCLWDDARKHLLRVLPYDRMDAPARAVVDFIVHLGHMHTIACRHRPLSGELLGEFECRGRDPKFYRDRDYLQVIYTVVSMNKDKIRASVDWHLVGLKAGEIVRDLITQAPEFRQFLRLPPRSDDIDNVVNVLPRGFGNNCTVGSFAIFASFRRIRRVKRAGRLPASVIAKHFLLSKGRLLPSGVGTNLSVAALSANPSAWLRANIGIIRMMKRCKLVCALRPIRNIMVTTEKVRDEQDFRVKKLSFSTSAATDCGYSFYVLAEHLKLSCSSCNA